MPEGPEIKTVTKTLQESVLEKELGLLWHSSLSLRKAADYQALKTLQNKKVSDISCYGKVIFFKVNEKTSIMAQLGMTGQLKVCEKNSAVEKHTHVRWPLKNTDFELRYVDPRRFGLVDACDEEKKQQIIAKLGPDPFLEDLTKNPVLMAKIAKSERAIKEILLDQSVVVGVGNIYASEALFLAGIKPQRKGSDLNQEQLKNLMAAVITVLNLAFKNNGTTFSNYVDGSGKKGDNLEFLQVFQRAGLSCFKCESVIERIKQGGRSSFYCPKCQK